MRLVDVDELYKLPCVHGADGTWICLEDIRNASTANVEPVVKCKDCKWRNALRCYHKRSSMYDLVSDNDFCSWGERKENGKIN